MQVEVVAYHCGEVVAVDFETCDVVAEAGAVDQHGMLVSRGVDLYCRAESRELAIYGLVFRTLAATVMLGAAIGVHFKPCILGIDGMVAVAGCGCVVEETAALELHPP